MEVKDIKVGQTFFVLRNDRRKGSDNHATLAKAVKVGRKYVTISGNWGTQFEETDTGKPYLVEHTGCGAPRLLFRSQKAVDEYQEQETLKLWVRTATDWNALDRYSLAQLRAVKEILGAAPPEQ